MGNETVKDDYDNDYNYNQNDFNFEDNFYYDEYYHGGFMGGFLGSIGGGPEPVPISGPDENTETDDVNDARAYFPETWIWDLFDISINGSYEKVLTVPDTVTEWVGSAICVHPSKGVGISNTATITVYKEFFIDLSFPSSVIRGEIFPVKISIFNYLNESLPITIILSSPDNKFEILEDSGNMTGSGMRNACVPLQDKIVLSIRIRAKGVGDVNISVEAIVQANAVSNCGSGIVQQQTYNLGDLVKMPYGCGEQNMINFAPNIFAMKYLDSTYQNTEDIAAKAIGFMKAGYERELNYRHRDGSFSAFGERDGSDEPGSTWLTAFVLKCFGQASAYISIDQNDLNLTLEWLKSLAK
ncbi:Pregnancy zone protein [Armadillidium vulgare]|nr:Pregnancy zone protein [Armadillidium vulgare]